MVILYSMQIKLRIHQIRNPYFQSYGTMFQKTVALWEGYESYMSNPAPIELGTRVPAPVMTLQPNQALSV